MPNAKTVVIILVTNYYLFCTATDLVIALLSHGMFNLQKVEQRERDDEAAGSHKHAGGSGDGKGKQRPKKQAMAETKPSSMGRRVIPVIDAALRAKVEAAAARKLKTKVIFQLLISLSLLQHNINDGCISLQT